MNPEVTVSEVRVIRDARGWVIEPVDEQDLHGIRNVHVVWTEPGHVRGNHYHRETTELLLVTGPARVCWEAAGRRQEVEVPAGAARRFVFPPGVAHAIQNTGSEPIVLIAFTNRPHDPTRPDTVRQVLIDA